MSDKIGQISSAVTQTGAGVAVMSFFSMQWWNENSAGILAICGAIGAVFSVAGFIVNLIHKRRIQERFKL